MLFRPAQRKTKTLQSTLSDYTNHGTYANTFDVVAIARRNSLSHYGRECGNALFAIWRRFLVEKCINDNTVLLCSRRREFRRVRRPSCWPPSQHLRARPRRRYCLPSFDVREAVRMVICRVCCVPFHRSGPRARSETRKTTSSFTTRLSSIR